MMINVIVKTCHLVFQFFNSASIILFATYQDLENSRAYSFAFVIIPFQPLQTSPLHIFDDFVKPPFLISLSIVSFIILAILIAYVRTRNLQNINGLLEKKVLEKTRELNEQNDELIRAISTLKAAQGQIIQTEKLTSMGQLTAGIAHELNNPLNYIRGGAECIINNLIELNSIIENEQNKEIASNENYRMLMSESKSLAESIISGAVKSTDIVKSLNSFTADGHQFYAYTDLTKEIENSLILLKNQIGFRITVNKFFASIPQIECYPTKINQVIVNILLNSIQAIKEKGEITIKIFRKDPENITLEISDDGLGISDEILKSVFEPFFTTKEAGSGLGLTISESIIREHKGQILIDSTIEKGTKVTIDLPINQTPQFE